MAIPQLIFALVLLSIVGTSITNLILIIAILDSTRVFRLTPRRGDERRGAGFRRGGAGCRARSWPGSCSREILPNILPPLVAEFGLRFCFVFLTISALSFLGLGIQPPTADWGSMVRENATLINYGDVTPLLPAGGDRAADGRRQLRRRLVPAQGQRPQGMSRHGGRPNLERGRTEARRAGMQATAAGDPGPPGRGAERRCLAGDRQGHRPDGAARRGAGADRRIRRRQIDHRPGRHGLCPARLPDHRRHRSSSTASIWPS